MKHCATCFCGSQREAQEREERLRQEKLDRERMEDFARRHSVLRAEDIAWAQQLVSTARDTP